MTKLFYERGWRGINLEPGERDYNRLCEDRPRDVNLNVAASNFSGEITYYEVPSCTGWATVSASQAPRFGISRH